MVRLPFRSLKPSATNAANHFPREPRRRALVPAAIANAQDLTQTEIEITQLRRINETMLRYTNVAVVIIDRSYRILTINSAARRLFARS